MGKIYLNSLYAGCRPSVVVSLHWDLVCASEWFCKWVTLPNDNRKNTESKLRNYAKVVGGLVHSRLFSGVEEIFSPRAGGLWETSWSASLVHTHGGVMVNLQLLYGCT